MILLQYLLESNGEGVLTEATTAHEEVVLADQTTARAADTAVIPRRKMKRH